MTATETVMKSESPSAKNPETPRVGTLRVYKGGGCRRASTSRVSVMHVHSTGSRSKNKTATFHILLASKHFTKSHTRSSYIKQEG